MKTEKAELLQNAFKDKGLQLKHLGVSDYMTTLELTKSLFEFVKEQGDTIQSVINDYNKDYNEKVKSPEYKEALKKKASGETLSQEDTALLAVRPTVNNLPNNQVSGPFDFIDKINSIREKEFKTKKLNYISDEKAFKAVVENASFESQSILHQYLFSR